MSEAAPSLPPCCFLGSTRQWQQCRAGGMPVCSGGLQASAVSLQGARGLLLLSVLGSFAECFREFCSRRESSVSLETGWTHHCPAILLFASCLSVCSTSPKQLQHHGFGFSAGFWAVGALLGSVKPPPLPLFINIRAKYRLFKLAVAVQILIAGFYFQDQRSGTEGSRVFLGEFSIYGDRAAQCLAKTWLGRGNKKEKKRKRVCSSSPSTAVTPALPRVCARAFSSPRDRGCRVA